jgi:hypothetical protein
MRTKVARLVSGFGLSVALAATGCSSLDLGRKGVSYPLQVGGEIPAAQGTVKVKQEKSGNQEVEVNVAHLAPPDLARAGSNYYVVWLKPEGTDQPTNAGVLSVSEDRTGAWKTVTPWKTFEVSVTPEASPTVHAPSKRPVLRAAVTPGGSGVM